ncbi:MAG: DUF6544 family protein [Acidimicrobiales bacterium]
MHLPLGPLARPLGRDLRGDVQRDAAEVLGGRPRPAATTVGEADIAGLPEPAQRYLRWMDVVGRPRDRSFLVRFTGRFKRIGQPWMPCEAWQFNAVQPITRLFHLRIDFARVIPMVGRDSYAAGRGGMRGKVLGLVTVADGSGREFDLGELVTWLNDAMVLAPSMLLTEAVRWIEVDDEAFDVSLTDGDNTVTARVLVDADGILRDFATEDRWCDLPGGLMRARWTTPFTGWTTVDGHPWLTGAQAVWDLPDGPLPYVDGTFVPDSMARDVWPGAWA